MPYLTTAALALLLGAARPLPSPVKPPVWDPAHSDTTSADKTPPPLILTPDLLTRVGTFLAQVKRDSTTLHALATDSANFAHVAWQLPPLPVPGLNSALAQAPPLALLDYGALAAKSTVVATAFQHAQLAPAQYLSIVQALTFALFTDTVAIFTEGTIGTPVEADSSTVLWQNVAFLRAHRPAVDALGLALPPGSLSNEKMTFLDTVALAKHLVRLRMVTDSSAGFPIGFMDSADVPANPQYGRAAPPLRVLFIGNSLTYYNTMPRIFMTLAAAGLHRRVVVGLVSVPAASPYVLWEATDVRDVLARLPWDAVVAQLQPGGHIAANAQRYAQLFTKASTAQHARSILWVQYRSPGEPLQGQLFLDSVYAAAARQAGASVASIPAAWEAVQHADDSTWHALYANLAADNDHPSPFGSYLIALVLYRTLTGQSPVGLPRQAGAVILPLRTADLLQRAAAAARP